MRRILELGQRVKIIIDPPNGEAAEGIVRVIQEEPGKKVDASSSGTVDNLKWYTDGSNNFGTGVTCIGNTASAYVQATGTAGQTGIELTTGNHASLAGSPSNVFSYTSGSPASVTGSTSTTGDTGHFFVYQIVVNSTAASGATASETFTWKYDDTSS